MAEAVGDLRESAAVHIQYWWRKWSAQKEMAPQKLAQISLTNRDLLKQLDELHRSKLSIIHKYEVMLNLPAGEINAYLEETNGDKTVVPEARTSIYNEYEINRRDQAARTIQRNIRAYQLRTNVKKWEKRLACPESVPKRIALINRITERIAETPAVRSQNLPRVKAKLAKHEENQSRNYEFCAKLEKTARDLNNLALAIEGILPNLDRDHTPLSLLHTSALAKTKAHFKHETDMETIYDKIYF